MTDTWSQRGFGPLFNQCNLLMNQSGLFSITHPSSAVTLKRTHSGKPGRLFDAGQAPKLPTIDSSDLILQVFTHKSLRRKASGNVDDYGDNERLAELGKIVLEAAVTLALYHHRPMLNLPDICVCNIPTGREKELKRMCGKIGAKTERAFR